MDLLLKHVYQKSISEILNKLLTQIDSDFDPEIMQHVQTKQQEAVSKLIDNLGSDKGHEHNLNAATILQDMFETKEFFNIMCQKENIEKIVNFSTAGYAEATPTSKTSALNILNQIVNTQIDRWLKKGNKDENKEITAGNNSDDDMIVQQKDSDDEGGDAAEKPLKEQTDTLVELL